MKQRKPSKSASKPSTRPNGKSRAKAPQQSEVTELPTRPGEGGETHQIAEGDRPILTTQQGIPVSDDQNSLRLGARGPQLLEDMHFREKIFHFDHERIPERVVHARGYGAHGFFETYESLADVTRADLFQKAGQRTPAFVRFSTVAGSKGSFDLARDVRGFAVKLYTREGNWDLVGNNIPVFFIQDPIKFPRPDPCGEARARPRVSPGAERPRHLLGLRLAHARDDAHGPVGDVGPRDPALIPVHGRLRRPHVPPRRCERQVDLREVPLEAEARAPVRGLERGGEDQRRRSRLPQARPLERDQPRRFSGVGARAPALRRGIRRGVRVRRARRDEAHPRGGGSDPDPRAARARQARRQLLRRDGAGGLLYAEHRARHRLLERSAPAGAELLVPRHAAEAPRWSQLYAPADQRAEVSVRAFPAGRPHGDAEPGGTRELRAEQLARGRGTARVAGARLPLVPGAGERRKAPRPRRELRRPLQPGAPVLPQPDARGAQARARRARVRAQQGGDRADPRARGVAARPRRRGAGRVCRQRARSPCAARAGQGGAAGAARPSRVSEAQHRAEWSRTASKDGRSAC